MDRPRSPLSRSSGPCESGGRRAAVNSEPPSGVASAEELVRRTALKAAHPVVPSSLAAGDTGLCQILCSDSSLVPSGVVAVASEQRRGDCADAGWHQGRTRTHDLARTGVYGTSDRWIDRVHSFQRGSSDQFFAPRPYPPGVRRRRRGFGIRPAAAGAARSGDSHRPS